MASHPAGKPVFTLHGEEGALAGFTALIQAVVSVVRGTGDTLQTVRCAPKPDTLLILGSAINHVALLGSAFSHPRMSR